MLWKCDSFFRMKKNRYEVACISLWKVFETSQYMKANETAT